MLERLIIALIIIGGLGLLWLGWQYFFKGRLVQSLPAAKTSLDRATLLYFTADYCSACKYQQGPIVNRVAEHFGDSLRIQSVDITEHPELATRYRVLTLPTTVVVDLQGRAAHINYGITQEAKLEKQLSKIFNQSNQGVFNELQHAA